MRYIKPELKTIRIKKWFAILPVTVRRETRWLENVVVEQIYLDKITPSGEPESDWHNVKFIND
jgi:hypothetical protein